jgi:hypothetical protein
MSYSRRAIVKSTLALPFVSAFAKSSFGQTDDYPTK